MEKATLLTTQGKMLTVWMMKAVSESFMRYCRNPKTSSCVLLIIYDAHVTEFSESEINV